jgi:hypothetical protein
MAGGGDREAESCPLGALRVAVDSEPSSLSDECIQIIESIVELTAIKLTDTD